MLRLDRASAAAVGLLLFAFATQASAERQWIEGGPNPVRYEIAVAPDAEAGVFSGEARISIEVAEPAAIVTMNALGLDISSARIDGRRVDFALDEAAQTLTLNPRRPLVAGRHEIRIVYSGAIQDEAYGLFRVSYQDDGVEKRALATQFEPGDARRLAPMWDQPNRRAVFALTVTAPSDQMAISNMPAMRSERLSDGRTRTHFADTPSMASYLLFLAVGDFERVTRDVDGVELGVVVRRGETHRAEAALQAGEESLRYFTDYFALPYPLPKLDMIGVPGAGGFGAMENWGAILYFDQYLLTDASSNDAERQNIFRIVAHEIAHQWFGNLVTMNWWNDLWLNEGFASWAAAKATEELHPDWNPWLAQMIDGRETAMALDARDGTHPVVQEVNTIDDANLAFDTITYQKGLAVIRMIEAYVGEEDFRTGVRAYFGEHLYANTETDDLWRAIQAASGAPILEIAHSFTLQPGFPVISARAACADGAQQLTLTQGRFAMDEAASTGERWSVPVIAQTLGDAPQRNVLPAAPSGAMTLPRCAPFLLNAGQSGFFRTLYDRANLEALRNRFGELDAADQLGLLLDHWSFGRAGEAPFTDYLELAAQISADANPLIVVDTAGSMEALAEYTENRTSAEAVRAYGRQTLRPFFDALGWRPQPGESANHGVLRAQLIETLAALGDEDVIAEARNLVRGADGGAAIDPSIRNSVIKAYALNASAEDYAALLARARAAEDFVEQRRLWLRLAGARDERLAQRTLDFVLGEDIPRQIRTQVLAGVAGEHPRLAWDFLVANRAAIEALLDPLQRLEFPTDIASTSSDPAIADALGVYAADFPEGARPTLAAAQAVIRLRAQTIAERMPAVEAWIASRTSPARGTP